MQASVFTAYIKLVRTYNDKIKLKLFYNELLF